MAIRRAARLRLKQIADALGVHPRTVRRWEVGDTHPSKKEWQRIVAYLASYAPQAAVDLASAAGVASPFPPPIPVDTRAIEDAISRAADILDVSPRRVRAAVRELTQAVTTARGTLVDLAKAAEEPLTADRS